MRTIIVGTTPVLLSSSNPRRVRFAIQFIPSSIVAGNTGLVFVGRGFIPNAVVADPNAGDILNSGSSIEEKKGFVGDILPYKGDIWVVSDTAGQQINFDEEVADEIGGSSY